MRLRRLIYIYLNTAHEYIYICIGYQNIPVNLDEAQRQIGIHTEYSIMSARSA